MPESDSAKLVMGDSDACFDVIVDLGMRPAVVLPSRNACRERRLLLRAAIAFIHQQHGSGSSWACYVAPAGAFEVGDACGRNVSGGPTKPV